jgi:competence protein ComEC
VLIYAAAAASVAAQWIVSAGWTGAAGATLIAFAASAAIFAARLLSYGRGTRGSLVSCGCVSLFGAAVVAALVLRSAGLPAPPSDPADVVSLARKSTSADGSVTAVQIDGVLRSVELGSGRSARCTVEVLHASAGLHRASRGTVLLFVRNASPDLSAGQRVLFRSKLRRIEAYGNPGEFDWAGYNARRGLFVSAFLWSDADLEVLESFAAAHASTRVVAGLGGFRRRVSELLTGRSQRSGALLAALLVGDRAAMDEDDRHAFRDAGLAHLLAISGLHVGMVVAAAFALGFALFVRTRPVRAGRDAWRGAACFAAAAGAAYVAVSGGGISISRATVMAAAGLACVWRGVRGDGARALALAAAAFGAWLPGVATEAGFQLSFAAAAALVAFAVRERSRGAPDAGSGTGGQPPYERSAGLGRLLSAFQIALLCWWVTTPIVAYHFGRVSWPAPLVNVIAAPVATATVLSGLAALVPLAVLGEPAASLFEPALLAASVLLELAGRGARLPGAGADVPMPPGVAVLALSMLPVVLPLRRRMRALAAVVLVACASISVAGAVCERFRADRLDAVFVSVGQGDASIVRLPGGRVAVVDGGPTGRGRSVVAPLLQRMRIGRIDFLIATHVQEDHWGGLVHLAERFEVGEFWHPGGRCQSRRFGEFLRDIAARGIPTVDVGAGADARVGEQAGVFRTGRDGWSLRSLWPRDASGDCSQNDRSVVLRLDFAGRGLVIGGDIEAVAERALVDAYGESLRADVATMPHHGSGTSSTLAWVAAVSPRIAVASVGRDNRYGFPRPDVVERYRRIGAETYRTDRDGAVRVALGVAGITVRTAKTR